jgi:membrane-bound ClpP family serine protease
MEMIEVIKALLQWAVAGLIGVVTYLFKVVGSQGTEIAVLKAVQAANKEAHDREFKEMKVSFAKVMDKLDNIEAHLRK